MREILKSQNSLLGIYKCNPFKSTIKSKLGLGQLKVLKIRVPSYLSDNYTAVVRKCTGHQFEFNAFKIKREISVVVCDHIPALEM